MSPAKPPTGTGSPVRRDPNYRPAPHARSADHRRLVEELEAQVKSLPPSYIKSLIHQAIEAIRLGGDGVPR